MTVFLIAAIAAAVFVAGALILFAVACLRAALIKKHYSDDKPFFADCDGLAPARHAENLSEMIKIPTISVRGSDDKTEIYKFHALLRRIYPNIHRVCEVVDIDGALLFRWAGKNAAAAPILLMSHQDVVEAVGNWKYAPFSGEIAEGKIWGRGTVDTKGALCAILESVEGLIAEGFTPRCDVYVASSNNEEITGDGAVKTVEYLYERGVRFDLVMDEGGTVMSEYDSRNNRMAAHNAMLGIFEKGRANIKFIANSSGGHASVPFNGNPFARLGELIYTIEKRNPFKKRITHPVRVQYKIMAPYMKHFRHRLLYGNLWLFAPFASRHMHKRGGALGAVVKTTCVFTMAEGSHGANVIPERATLTANCRFMIHEPLKVSYAKLGKIAKKLGLHMEMITGFDVPPVADMKCYAYKYVNDCIKKVFGDIPRVPYVMLAGTDARHYTKICDCVLRFVPLMMTGEQLNSAHAVNENLSVESLARGVVFYREFIKNYGETE
ncbi:MAG: M20/M25/M40 family metallo-hydrolase [Oscillospiraceae bacterium]|jgi:carboxypeptidase PM20D1|nr:M20/M25/M40 family metallo-hydrolase [Oscillospiraceae bacterium]